MVSHRLLNLIANNPRYANSHKRLLNFYSPKKKAVQQAPAQETTGGELKTTTMPRRSKPLKFLM